LKNSNPKIWKIAPGKIPPGSISEGAALLAEGGVVVYPTETFYALGAIPFMEVAVDRIFSMKGRDSSKPLPLIASRRESVLIAVSYWSDAAEKLASLFWPGPLTLVLPASPKLSPLLHAGTGKVAVRISSHPVAALLAESAGGLLVSTSANRAGEKPPCHTEEMDSNLLLSADGLIDSGELPGGLPSTIVDASASAPRLIRKGTIGWETIQRAFFEKE